MGEIVLGTYRPSPGQDPADFEIPGPGLYEADFGVPDWLLPDFKSERNVTVPVGGKKIQHLRSEVHGSILTVRFEVTEDPTAQAQAPHVEIIQVVTLLAVLDSLAPYLWAAIAVFLVHGIVSALKEVRKLGSAPGGFALGAGALVVAGLGIVAYMKGR